MSNHATLSAKYRSELLNKLPTQIRDYPINLETGSNLINFIPESGLLTDRQLEITSLDAVELLEKIRSRAYTSREATMAFGLRAAIAHRLTCCLTDFWLDEALIRAQELDDHLERTGHVIGPLHGLPISLKDQFEVKGHVTSLSYLSIHQTAKPCPESSSFVKLLESQGAIHYCHTNLPQTIMHLSTSSFWGNCLNPYNTSLTPGGSSGGESALIALRGSPLGIGTDIGGSVRSPAANCGLWSLRPTSLRLPSAAPAVPGRDSIMGTSGPLTSSLRDLELFMNLVLGSTNQIWRDNIGLLEMSWDSRGSRKGEWENGGRKLRIGVMWEDGEVRPNRPIQRALEWAVEKLRSSDQVEIVDFEPWKMREGWELTRQLVSSLIGICKPRGEAVSIGADSTRNFIQFFPDGGKRAHQLLDESDINEPLEPLTKWLLEDAGKEPLKDHSVHELWELNVRRESYRASFRRHWNESGVDVVLSPVAPTPAPKHGEAKWWAYTSHWNVVDHPALVFPTPLAVDPAKDAEPTVKAGDWRNDDERLVHENYSLEDFTNAPLGLQLIARKYHDEEVVEAMKLMETILQL